MSVHKVKRNYKVSHNVKVRVLKRSDYTDKNYRGIGLFKYRASVRSPFMWRNSDPWQACKLLSVYAWHKMR